MKASVPETPPHLVRGISSRRWAQFEFVSIAALAVGLIVLVLASTVSDADVRHNVLTADLGFIAVAATVGLMLTGVMRGRATARELRAGYTTESMFHNDYWQPDPKTGAVASASRRLPCF